MTPAEIPINVPKQHPISTLSMILEYLFNLIFYLKIDLDIILLIDIYFLEYIFCFENV